jgi:hypothetical protein
MHALSQQGQHKKNTSNVPQLLSSKGLFGRASTPGGALPNGRFCNGSRCGVAPGAPRGFQRGGEATISWLHAAPPSFSHRCPQGAGGTLAEAGGGRRRMRAEALEDALADVGRGRRR